MQFYDHLQSTSKQICKRCQRFAKLRSTSMSCANVAEFSQNGQFNGYCWQKEYFSSIENGNRLNWALLSCQNEKNLLPNFNALVEDVFAIEDMEIKEKAFPECPNMGPMQKPYYMSRTNRSCIFGAVWHKLFQELPGMVAESALLVVICPKRCSLEGATRVSIFGYVDSSSFFWISQTLVSENSSFLGNIPPLSDSINCLLIQLGLHKFR